MPEVAVEAMAAMVEKLRGRTIIAVVVAAAFFILRLAQRVTGRVALARTVRAMPAV